MVKKILAERSKGKYIMRDIELVEDSSQLAPLTSDLGKKILGLISKRHMYTSEIAKALGQNEQKVYYHINQMKKNNLIHVVHEEEKNGALCKFYSPIAGAFGFELSKSDKLSSGSLSGKEPLLKKFFGPFVSTGIFDGFFVVGSPIEHGPYLTGSRDAPYAVPLALLVGSICELGDRSAVLTDVEIISKKMYQENMIIIGGPIANMVSAELNEKMKIKFLWKEKWVLHTDMKDFSGRGVGLVCNIKNPWDVTKRLIVFAGLDFMGTKASIELITHDLHKIEKSYSSEMDFYAIVQAEYNEKEGKIENVRIIESSSI